MSPTLLTVSYLAATILFVLSLGGLSSPEKSRRGNLYGIDKRPSQIGPWAFSPRTDFDGLYLCGQSTISHGVAGVTASGVNAAQAVLNCRANDILTQKGPGPLFLQAEKPGTWPEHMRRKMERGEKAREEDEKEI